MNQLAKPRIYTHSASEALSFLAQVRDQLADFRRNLLIPKEGQAPSVADVVYDVECRQYESGLTLEMWAEAQVVEGDALRWWLDMIYGEEGWLLDGRVSWNGQDVVFETPVLTLPDFQAAQHKAVTMLEELFRAARYSTRGCQPRLKYKMLIRMLFRLRKGGCCEWTSATKHFYLFVEFPGSV